MGVMAVRACRKLFWKMGRYLKEVRFSTDKEEYASDEKLKFKAINGGEKRVCFSSCYPYYIEKSVSGKWEAYQYQNCQNPNLAENCVEPGKIKAFEMTLPSLGKDSYRLAIPVCVECQLNAPFKEENWSYSNEFVIK